MENKIAIDIVLLLPDDMNKVICDLSSKIIPPKNAKPYVLDNVNYFPHVSLLMGTALESEIESIKEKLEPIFKKYIPFEINFTNIDTSHQEFPGLVIEKTQELINLRSEIADVIHLDNCATKEMFFDFDISDSAVDFVNNYREKKLDDKDKFELHTTLGFGDVNLLDINLPLKTTVNTLAIYHLGYCLSCRKVLAKVISK